MKGIPQQIFETQNALIASGKFTTESVKEAVKDCSNEEHRLAVLKGLSKKNGIKEVGLNESVEIRESRQRVERKNGRGIQESGLGDNGFTAEEKRIEARMIATGATYREAHCFVTQGKPLPVGTKEPAKFTEARKERLKKAYGSILSEGTKATRPITETDLNTMAERGIEP
jgi:hypothetical protein